MGWERSEIPFWIVKFEVSFSPESGDFELAIQWKSSVQERGLGRAHKFRKFGRLCLKLRNGYYHRGVSLRRERNFPYTRIHPQSPPKHDFPVINISHQIEPMLICHDHPTSVVDIRFTLSGVHPVGWYKRIMTCIRSCSVIRSTYTALKSSVTLPSHTLPQIPGNH